MKIGGFLKQSLIDYPGKIASVIFTQGCNFRCFYCHNPELVLPGLASQEINLEDIYSYLDKNKDLLDAVVISGGEPTIHNDLPEFLSKIKQYKLAVKLDSNGTNPDMLEHILQKGLVDYIAMDIKAPLVLEKYRDVVGAGFNQYDLGKIIKSIELIKNSGIDFEFRTTLVKPVHSLQDIQVMADALSGKYYLQRFRAEKTLSPDVKNKEPYTDEELEVFMEAHKSINLKLRLR